MIFVQCSNVGYAPQPARLNKAQQGDFAGSKIPLPNRLNVGSSKASRLMPADILHEVNNFGQADRGTCNLAAGASGVVEETLRNP